MKNDALGKSIPLGFWAKHVDSVDAIYDLYLYAEDFDTDFNKLPEGLSEICANQEARAQLVNIIEASEIDIIRINDSVISKIHEICSSNTKILMNSKKNRDRYKDLQIALKKNNNKKIIVSSRVDTVLEHGLSIQLVFWTKTGGRHASIKNAEIIYENCGYRPTTSFQDKNNFYWYSTIVLLSRISLNDFVSDNLPCSIDLDKAVSKLLEPINERLPLAFIAILESQ